jgi:protein ImuB
VSVGLRRRDAQARCPELVVLADDPAGAARAFEPVVAALEVLTPRLQVVQPGCVALPTRGPSRYHGGDQSLARLAVELLVGTRVGAGVADGLFAATLAARRAAARAHTQQGDDALLRRRGAATATGSSKPSAPAEPPTGPDSDSDAAAVDPVWVVPPGDSARFLAPLPLRVLDQYPDLIDVLRRLGLRTLGELAALPTGNVVGRFGTDGLVAQRLATGLDPHPPSTTPPPPDLRVSVELDPPAERVETAAFAARGLAEELHQRLTRQGSACTQLSVGAESEHGEQHERIWRTDGSFGPAAIADRLRWQLDGWLNSAHRPTGGLTRLWLHPEEVVAAGGRQLSFAAGGSDAIFAAERARRAVARAQSLVGLEAVSVPERRGGRGPGERVTLVTAGLVDLTELRPATSDRWVGAPWPGAVPAPAPSVVLPRPSPVRLLDAAGFPVRVNGRGELSADPVVLATADRGRPQALALWAGPWPCDERWWDASGHRRRVRLQVVTRSGAAHLLILEAGRWSIEATYD